MSATTDVVLAAGPTVVALAAIGSAFSQQRRTFSHDRAMTDLADVRAVADAAAIAMHHAAYALGTTRQDFITHGQWIAERATANVKLLHERGEALDAVQERLSIRLGPDHEMVVQFKAANSALLKISEQVRRPSDLLDAQEGWSVIHEQGEEFETRRHAFVRAAVEAIGARLE